MQPHSRKGCTLMQGPESREKYRPNSEVDFARPQFITQLTLICCSQQILWIHHSRHDQHLPSPSATPVLWHRLSTGTVGNVPGTSYALFSGVRTGMTSACIHWLKSLKRDCNSRRICFLVPHMNLHLDSSRLSWWQSYRGEQLFTRQMAHARRCQEVGDIVGLFFPGFFIETPGLFFPKPCSIRSACLVVCLVLSARKYQQLASPVQPWCNASVINQTVQCSFDANPTLAIIIHVSTLEQHCILHIEFAILMPNTKSPLC